MISQAIANGQLNPRLIRKFLQSQGDWEEWKNSEHKQLDSYEKCEMFGQPCQRPPNSNVLPLIWTYLNKLCGTTKTRCVCNISPQMKGTVSLAYTYAAAPEQPGARMFWALSALHNYTVYRADATNAFAKTPPPIAPLYVTIDKKYRKLWENV